MAFHSDQVWKLCVVVVCAAVLHPSRTFLAQGKVGLDWLVRGEEREFKFGAGRGVLD